MAGAARLQLLESKLHVPRRRRGVVPRARLSRRLDRESLPAVVLVSAPAGFGKTTLLAEWLDAEEEKRNQTAWLSLDRRDSDPAMFWSYVVAAIRKVAAGAGADALHTLQSTPTALEAVVTSLLNDLEGLADDVVLVLDDYHLVESLAVHESMLFLIEHLPERVHLVVASRADPPWPLAGLRARGELLEVRASDLRFTSQEAAAYLNDTMGLDLAASDVDALEARTEGWIAALQLAALSLRDRDDPAAFIAEFAGDDRFLVDYLVDEVLDRQTDNVRRFLLETSILNRLTAPLCAAVTGRSETKTTLEALERSNLFLVALDDRRQWYRYHHLFGEVLRARLADEDADRVTALHRRASAWFETAGDRAEAIRHAMAARDFAKAAELVELSVADLRQARQEATLRAWLDALPRDVFANRPVLSLALVGSHMATGDTAGVEELLDHIERWIDPDLADEASGPRRPATAFGPRRPATAFGSRRPDTAFGPRRPDDDMVVHDHAEFRLLPTQVAMYRAGLALLAGDLAGTVTHGRRAARLSDADDHFGQGAAAALIGLAHWAGGDLESAERQYAAAIASFRRAGFLPDILACSLGLSDIQVAQGRLGAAQRTLNAGLQLAAEKGPLRGTADMHVGLGELHFERNQLEAAAEHLQASLELGDHLALPQHAYRWRVLEARLRAARGDHRGALALLDEAARRYNTDYSPSARPVTATAARMRLADGDLAGAQQWAVDLGVGVDDEPAYIRDYEQLTFARLLLATHRPADAVGLLQRILAASELGHRDGTSIEALALLALAHDAAGDTPQSLAALEEALTRAAVEGFVRIFLDVGAPMRALLRTAVRHGRAADQAAGILADESAPPRLPQHGLVEPLSSRELDVLRLLRSDLSGPEIAAELVVSLNTVRTHTKNIFMKLGVNSRRAAVRRADELGL